LVDDLSANSAFSSDEKLEFRGNFDACPLPFDVRTDGRFGTRERGADSAGVGAASRSMRRNDSSRTRLGRIRPLGVDDTPTRDGSAASMPNAAAKARCDPRSAACGGLVSDDCASGFDAVASLGRRRTSTVNEGTARLNVVLAAAQRSADSSRRRGPCEAKRSNAIGDQHEPGGADRRLHEKPREACVR
jgi:hypothetical protein